MNLVVSAYTIFHIFQLHNGSSRVDLLARCRTIVALICHWFLQKILTVSSLDGLIRYECCRVEWTKSAQPFISNCDIPSSEMTGQQTQNLIDRANLSKYLIPYSGRFLLISLENTLMLEVDWTKKTAPDYYTMRYYMATPHEISSRGYFDRTPLCSARKISDRVIV